MVLSFVLPLYFEEEIIIKWEQEIGEEHRIIIHKLLRNSRSYWVRRGNLDIYELWY